MVENLRADMPDPTKATEADLNWHLLEYRERGHEDYLAPLLAPLRVHDGSSFVDIGCGSGYINGFLAARNRLSHNVGLDLAPETVFLARQMHDGDGSIAWICASAESIPLRAASVDVVVCRGVVPLATVDNVLAEVARILRPGGKAAFLLHSWSFYLRWLSLDPRKWKKSVAGLLHFCLGIWFNATGQQVRVKLRGRRIGQTFQTKFRMRRVLAKHALRLYQVQRKNEFLIYCEKLTGG